jgi:hypothetical protein
LWSIARVDLGLNEDEFLEMVPAALELLMRRLQMKDRKALHGPAMICAETWNAAGMNLNRTTFPDGLAACDFLPELPEDRARREADEELLRTAPQDSPQFAAFKAGLDSLAQLSPEQKAAHSALVQRLKTGVS